jgi:queuine/archaeosine tRNA-ribosyltransferase
MDGARKAISAGRFSGFRKEFYAKREQEAYLG